MSPETQTYSGDAYDFFGLPSLPICIYRTGEKWPFHESGTWTWHEPREARPVYDKKLQDVWDTLHVDVYSFLDSMDINWSTIDPVRFAEKEESEVGTPIYLWIGVEPGSLSFERAQEAAVDFEVAFRESSFFRSNGLRLYEHDAVHSEVLDIRSPFTPSLGIRFAPKDQPHHEGSGALYFRESEASDRILLLTTRHVALPPSSAHSNQPYSRKNSDGQRDDIIILGDKAYNEAVDKMLKTLEDQQSNIQSHEYYLKLKGEPVEGENPEKIYGAKEEQGSYRGI